MTRRTDAGRGGQRDRRSRRGGGGGAYDAVDLAEQRLRAARVSSGDGSGRRCAAARGLRTRLPLPHFHAHGLLGRPHCCCRRRRRICGFDAPGPAATVVNQWLVLLLDRRHSVSKRHGQIHRRIDGDWRCCKFGLEKNGHWGVTNDFCGWAVASIFEIGRY
jgi:hypothetical protein